MKEHLQHLIQKNSEDKLTLKEQIELSEFMADKSNRIYLLKYFY